MEPVERGRSAFRNLDVISFSREIRFHRTVLAQRLLHVPNFAMRQGFETKLAGKLT
jgi:hypothetical protein